MGAAESRPRSKRKSAEPGPEPVVQYGSLLPRSSNVREFAPQPACRARCQHAGHVGVKDIQDAEAGISPSAVPGRVLQRAEHASVLESRWNTRNRHLRPGDQHVDSESANPAGFEVYILTSEG